VPNQRAEDQTRLTFSLPVEMYEAIDRKCQERDITKSQYIRQLLREDAAKYGTSVVPSVPVADRAAVEGCPHRKMKAAS
jgi:hypothetical protein